MRIYPDLPFERARAIAFDVLIIIVLWLCWLIGTTVHHTVAELDVLGRGVQSAGTQVQDAFDNAGDRVNGAPVVGNRLEDALKDAGDQTGTPVVRAGTKGREAVADLAQLLGWIAGGVPALMVLLRFGPARVTAARRVLGARRVMRATDNEEELRMLAMRAAFALPFSTLLRFTKDPFGDLAAGRLEPLLAAIGAEYGLRPAGNGVATSM